MLIGRDHRRWFVGTVIVTVVSTVVYAAYAWTAPAGPKGGSWVGLAFGTAGALMIGYAGFLGARKKMLTVRIGSVTWWMKGHLWLGTLSLPMVFFHGAFHFGGPLTTVLMALLLIIVVSGLIGAVLQHAVPRVLTAQVAKETPYEQINRIVDNLRTEALERVTATCTTSEQKDPAKAPAPVAGQEKLKQFYDETIAPYLQHPGSSRARLSSSVTSSLLFNAIRPEVDPKLHDVLTDLEHICDEIRQKVRQMKLHRLLHGWLLLHIPLSMALLVLMVVHAVLALYY